MSVYTPPALNAVDFALTAYTPANIAPYEIALSSYTPPALNAVNFALTTYTTPIFPDVGWELLPSVDQIATIATGQGGQTSDIVGTIALSAAIETGQGSQTTDITATVAYIAEIETGQGSQSTNGVLTATSPTPVDLTVGGAGPGFNLFRKRQDEERRNLRKAIEMAMGLVDDPRPEVREEAKAIIAVAADKPVTQINQVNFTLILESQRTLEAIWVHFDRLKAAKLAEEEEDEEIALILLN